MGYPVQGKIRWGQISLVLIIGIGIGSLTPWLLQTLPLQGQAELGKPVLVDPAIGASAFETSTLKNSGSQDSYFCRIEQDKTLSIYQGLPTREGQRILSGLDVSKWSSEMQAMAEKIEFHSLDEVQSFIDSLSEELWLE